MRASTASSAGNLIVEGESAEDFGADSERRRSQEIMAGEAISRGASSWREPAGQVSSAQVGMGAGAFNHHRIGCQLIDQQPVRFDVTLTTTGKPTYQNGVPLVRRQVWQGDCHSSRMRYSLNAWPPPHEAHQAFLDQPPANPRRR
jgi:hypothetical protein